MRHAIEILEEAECKLRAYVRERERNVHICMSMDAAPSADDLRQLEEIKVAIALLKAPPQPDMSDLPIARLQLPDGSVPANTEEALAAWHRIAEERGQVIRKLQAAYDAVQGHGISLPLTTHYSEDMRRGYQRGVDSQRAAARQAFEEEEE